jgi:hypothetical protein
VEDLLRGDPDPLHDHDPSEAICNRRDGSFILSVLPARGFRVSTPRHVTPEPEVSRHDTLSLSSYTENLRHMVGDGVPAVVGQPRVLVGRHWGRLVIVLGKQ